MSNFLKVLKTKLSQKEDHRKNILPQSQTNYKKTSRNRFKNDFNVCAEEKYKFKNLFLTQKAEYFPKSKERIDIEEVKEIDMQNFTRLPIRPGVRFFFDIIKYLNRQICFQIQIPKTLLKSNGKIFLIKTKKGKIVIKENYSIHDFFKKINSNPLYDLNINNNQSPSSVMKSYNSVNPSKVIVVLLFRKY